MFIFIYISNVKNGETIGSKKMKYDIDKIEAILMLMTKPKTCSGNCWMPPLYGTLYCGYLPFSLYFTYG